MEEDFSQFSYCIVGMGLIGGSYAKALRNKGALHIAGIDRTETVLKEALRLGCIDEGGTEGADILGRADICILCLDGDIEEEWFRIHAQDFRPGTLITDAAGVKGNRTERLQKMLPEGVEFLAGHPMAGREGKGFAMADGAIFQGANYLLTPNEKNSQDAVKKIEGLARWLGCAHVLALDAQTHDRMMAYTSDLPHVLAAVLVQSPSIEGPVKYCMAGSFRDATRVADINSAMWTKLFLANQGYLLEEISHFQDTLNELKRWIGDGDAECIRDFLEQSRQKKRSLYEDHTCTDPGKGI